MTRVYSIDTTNAKMMADVDKYIREHGEPKADLSSCLDQVAVAYEGDEVVGLFFSRPMLFLHDFMITPRANRRAIAEALFNYVLGAAAAGGHTEGFGIIDSSNIPMIRFMQDAGAQFVSSPNKDVVYIIQGR